MEKSASINIRIDPQTKMDVKKSFNYLSKITHMLYCIKQFIVV